jgi:type VI secretion system protein ImpK
MLHHQYQDSFIYRFFSAFYTEVLREKQKALSQAGPQLQKLDEAKMRFIAEQIIAHLESFLRDSEEEALKGGSYIQSGYKTVQYIAVVLTDEIFLNLNWQGQAYWDKNILESRLFNTRKGGEKLFHDLGDFLEQNDMLRTDIAAVYLHALALGFQGKYRHTQDLSIIDLFMGKLYEFIYRQSPKVFTHDANLFPEAYAYTIRDAEPQKLPDPYRWYYYYLMGVTAFLLITYIMWFDLTFELKSSLYELIQLGK